jgi:hypothetical protein
MCGVVDISRSSENRVANSTPNFWLELGPYLYQDRITTKSSPISLSAPKSTMKKSFSARRVVKKIGQDDEEESSNSPGTSGAEGEYPLHLATPFSNHGDNRSLMRTHRTKTKTTNDTQI